MRSLASQDKGEEEENCAHYSCRIIHGLDQRILPKQKPAMPAHIAIAIG